MSNGKQEDKTRGTTFLIAETAFSHEGNLEYLKKQIDAASEAGANAIKFQILLDAEESYSLEVINSSEVFNWTFTEEEWKDVILYAREKKLQVVVLPIDMKAMDFCEKNAALYEMIEVHSINFNHKFMLERMDNIQDKIIVLGEGGRTLADIEYALNKLSRAYSESRILLMHGFQSFPTQPENLRMGRIKKYKEFFNVKMGYADHTAYDADDITLIQIAYANGARYFEKHIVLEKGEKRTDYQAAVDAAHLKEIKKAIEQIEIIQGEYLGWELNEAEKRYRGREKKIVALDDICEGTILSEKNLGYKVTNEEKKLEQNEMEQLIGKVARFSTTCGSTDIG